VGDLVFQIQLALLEALELQLVLNSTLGKAGNDVIEVSVLEMQLIDALPEHFTVGRSYHGQHLHTDLTESSIDPTKIKNEAAAGRFPAPARGSIKALFSRRFDAQAPGEPGFIGRWECR
jgi:hypothetical protein